MAMMKKQHFNPQSLLMFSFAAFLCPIITAGFQEPLDWETGLDEEMYNLQSEPIFYDSSHPAILFDGIKDINEHQNLHMLPSLRNHHMKKPTKNRTLE